MKEENLEFQQNLIDVIGRVDRDGQRTFKQIANLIMGGNAAMEPYGKVMQTQSRVRWYLKKLVGKGVLETKKDRNANLYFIKS